MIGNDKRDLEITPDPHIMESLTASPRIFHGAGSETIS